jgi:hypothetical protein
MTPEARFDRIDRTLEYVLTLQSSRDEQIAKLVEQSARHETRMELLTERTIQAMDAINRLAPNSR